MPAGEHETSVARAVTQFALSGLAALVLVAVGGVLVLRERGVNEEIHDAQRMARLVGHYIIEPSLTPALIDGDTDAITKFDGIVEREIRERDERVARVKIWTRSGHIVYSDEPRLIGRNFTLDAEDAAVLDTGEVEAELSDLSASENQFEKKQGKLLEVYMPVEEGSTGEKLLFEIYLHFDSIVAGGRKTWLGFLPVALAALIVLAVLQIPLAWSMARRLRERQRDRMALLKQALDASETERRRIAADLHDGVVQDLAGLSFSLAAAAQRFENDEQPDAATALSGAASETRQRVRELRSLIVDIHPPRLQSAGLAAALSDLASRLDARGVRVRMDVPADLRVGSEVERLVFRTAQEALRNVQAHAEASAVDLRVERQNGAVALVVEDDGRGFSPEEVARRRVEGHLGLVLLADLAARHGGELAVDSRPGNGTRLRLEVPAA